MKPGYRLMLAFLMIFAIFPCSVDMSPSFIPVMHPEKFDTAFLRGELGIIPATLSGKYKLIAWRYLAGIPLDPQEQEAILADEKRNYISDDSKIEWQSARRSAGFTDLLFIAGGKGSRLDAGAFYENCLPDAFAVATRTLNARKTAYADGKTLTAWIRAQDQVFQNCDSNQPNYPDDPGPELPLLARADRMYQLAAAHFYAEDLTDAEKRFREIASDNNSPWHDTAAYLVGRTLIRKYSLEHKAEALAQAKVQFLTITTSPLQNSAQGLIGYATSLSDPAALIRTLSATLSSHAGTAFSRALADASYALRSDRFSSALAQPDLPEPFDWIQALQPDQTDYALRRWQQSHTTLWLTAALIQAKPSRSNAGQKENAELIDAAFKVPESSPAFDTVMTNSIRLMIGDGQRVSSRRSLDALLAAKRHRLDSVENAYRAQRMSLATSFDDFLRWATRRPIGMQDEEYSERASVEIVDKSPVLADDSVAALNNDTPLTRLADAAESARLPQVSRTTAAIAGWTRAFILGDDNVANRLALRLEGTYPKWASDLEAFRKASGDEKRFTGALLIARHSDFHPEIVEYGPNWWCPPSKPNKSDNNMPEAVLSPAERAEAFKQVGRVSEAGTAQNILAPIVMSWARTHPGDSRTPEALHRLVWVTRYGCRSDSANGQISKVAFDLLHSRYPASEWTRQTPYWFN